MSEASGTAAKPSAEIAAFVAEFDHHSTFYRDHLTDIFKHMHAHCPVVHSKEHGGFWVFTRYEDIMAIARDDVRFSSADGIIIPQINMGFKRLPIELDPPTSLPFRAPLNPVLAPRAVAAQKPRIRQLAADLIKEKLAAGRLDAVLDLAQPIAGIVTLELLGLDPTEWPHYAGPIHDATFGNIPREEATKRGYALHQRIVKDVHDQIEHPTGGLIQTLLETEVQGRRLTPDEVVSMVHLVHEGGLDTAQAIIGCIVVHLARNTAHRAQLVEDPSLMDSAIEEFLRFMAPQQALARTATVDCEVGGTRIAKGDKVLMVWAAANFDEKEFVCPYEIDLKRTDNRHMTFGVGSHRCVGSHLARAEITACIEALLALVPDYTLDEANLEFAKDVGIVFGYNTVPIVFTPR